MPRWHTTTRGSQDLLATALPQMALEQPLTALNAMQLSSRLLGAPQTAREVEDEDSGETRYQLLRQQVHSRLVEDTAYLAETDDAAVRERLAELVNQTAVELGWPLNLEEGFETVTRIHNELLGFGPWSGCSPTPASPRSWSTARRRSGSSGAGGSRSRRTASRPSTS